jgi:hypothetical protein
MECINTRSTLVLSLPYTIMSFLKRLPSIRHGKHVKEASVIILTKGEPIESFDCAAGQLNSAHSMHNHMGLLCSCLIRT